MQLINKNIEDLIPYNYRTAGGFQWEAIKS